MSHVSSDNLKIRTICFYFNYQNCYWPRITLIKCILTESENAVLCYYFYQLWELIFEDHFNSNIYVYMKIIQAF